MVHASIFSTGRSHTTQTLKNRRFHNSDSETDVCLQALSAVREDFRTTTHTAKPDYLVIRVPFGGSEFAKPVWVDTQALQRLQELIPQSPLLLPKTLAFIQTGSQVFPGVAILLVFETAFFANLPLRERLYGLEPKWISTLQLRRYGFHGIFHEAACRFAARSCHQKAGHRPSHILSLCLEPQVEIAAVIGKKPVMVTSGVTPLEGIPGPTTCGEIDSSIVLKLRQKLEWGPEKINLLLTQQSGLLGLVGRPTDLNEALTTNHPDLTLAQQMLRYRILSACGSGIAAMGNLDALVFSGRYAAVGKVLGPWLTEKLQFQKSLNPKWIDWWCFEDSLDQLIGENALATILSQEKLCAA